MNFRKGGLIIAVLLLIAIILLDRKEVQLVEQNSFVVSKISANGYQLRSVIKLKNPNLLSSTIKSVNENFYVNDALVSITHQQLDQGIPGMKETELPMMVRFEGGDFLKPKDSTQLNTPLNIRISGDIEYSNFTGDGKIKVEVSDKTQAK